MSREETLKCLDSLALALTEHNHQWTPEQRSSYERCAASLRLNNASDVMILLRRWERDGLPPIREVA